MVILMKSHSGPPEGHSVLFTIETSVRVRKVQMEGVMSSIEKIIDERVHARTRLVLRTFSDQVDLLFEGQKKNLNWPKIKKSIQDSHEQALQSPYQRPIKLYDAWADTFRGLSEKSNSYVILFTGWEDLWSTETMDSVLLLLGTKVLENCHLTLIQFGRPLEILNPLTHISSLTNFKLLFVQSKESISVAFNWVSSQVALHSNEQPLDLFVPVVNFETSQGNVCSPAQPPDPVNDDALSDTHTNIENKLVEKLKPASATTPKSDSKTETTLDGQSKFESLTSSGQDDEDADSCLQMENSSTEPLTKIMVHLTVVIFCSLILIFILMILVQRGPTEHGRDGLQLKDQVGSIELRIESIEKSLFQIQMDKSRLKLDGDSNYFVTLLRWIDDWLHWSISGCVRVMYNIFLMITPSGSPNYGQWVSVNRDGIAKQSLEVSPLKSGGKIYIARTFVSEEVVVGKSIEQRNGRVFAFIPSQGKEIIVHQFETLVIESDKVAWIPNNERIWSKIEFAVQGGIDRNGHKILIGRSYHDGEWVVGSVRYFNEKVNRYYKLFFPWGGKQAETCRFDILFHDQLWA